MIISRSGRPSLLGYCLLAAILLGCFVLYTRDDDSSATMAPNLVFHR